VTVICRELGLLFLQTPHTGSTAIGSLLRAEYGGERIASDHVRDTRGRAVLRRKHQTLQGLLDAGLITPEERRRLVVAAGVRNPFDIVFTEFARTRTHGRFVRVRRLLSRLAGGAQDERADFERFVERRYAPGRLLRWLGRKPRIAEDWAAGADQVIRFERLQQDFDAVMRRVGAEPVTIPPTNVTERRRGRGYREVYTQRAREIVEAAYVEQLERYGYRFEASEVAGDEPDAAPDAASERTAVHAGRPD
jgi:hypothetical protein